MGALLILDNISKTFRTSRMVVEALRNVSLRIEREEFIAFMGPSGCGKSTLLLTAGTLLSPDAGTVRFGEADPYALPPDRRAVFRSTTVGFVFQQFHLIPYLNVGDNIRIAAIGRECAVVSRRADELLERFGLTARGRHFPSELSVGERQRVGLARAMLNAPPLLLADEPTGNLDAASGSVVLEALADYARGGAAVLMVTHDPLGQKKASRVISMKQGALEV